MIDKKVRIRQIAQLAEVSPSTVSRVLNHPQSVRQETRAAVYQAMQTLGITPERPEPQLAKSAARKPKERSNVILLNFPNYNNPFFSEIFKGVQDSATVRGYNVIIYAGVPNRHTLRDFLSLIETTQAQGVISMCHLDAETLLALSSEVPLVQCSEYSESMPTTYVAVDDRSAAKNATEYILSTGHQKIAFINSSNRNRFARHRYEGFQQALEEAHITIPNSWVVNLPNLEYDTAFAAITQILSGARIPNAIFTVSDIFAMAALNVARNFNLRVPEDLIVVGFDDVYLSTMSYPTLTTVSMPCYQMGYASGEMLLEKIASPNEGEKHILFNARLVIRGSSSSSNIDRMVVGNSLTSEEK